MHFHSACKIGTCNSFNDTRVQGVYTMYSIIHVTPLSNMYMYIWHMMYKLHGCLADMADMQEE